MRSTEDTDYNVHGCMAAAVGLDSGIQASEFKRKRLNIVILLDVSGSMGSPFDTYYYVRFVSLACIVYGPAA